MLDLTRTSPTSPIYDISVTTQALRVDVLRVIVAADAAHSLDDPAALLSAPWR